MSWPELGWLLLGAVFLVCLGMLLGATWQAQAIQPRLRQRAEERRQLNEEWLAVRAARRQLSECPRCGFRFTAWDPYFAPTRTDGPQDDD